MRRAASGLAIVALLAGCGGARESATGEHAKMVQPLGAAYASDYGLTLEKVETAAPAVVADANRAELESKVVKALSVGYQPKAGAIQALDYARASDIITVKMKGDRTPADAAKSVVAPGARVVETTWHFAGCAPIRSVGVYAADDKLLFDTLMSMPVIETPVVKKHF